METKANNRKELFENALISAFNQDHCIIPAPQNREELFLKDLIEAVQTKFPCE